MAYCWEDAKFSFFLFCVLINGLVTIVLFILKSVVQAHSKFLFERRLQWHIVLSFVWDNLLGQCNQLGLINYYFFMFSFLYSDIVSNVVF